MRKAIIVVALALASVAGHAQEWIEHGGAEYNCIVLRGIIADYGDSDLSRSSGDVMTVGELFAFFFPSCPPVADAASVVSDEQEITVDAEVGTSSHTALYSFSSDEAGLQPVLGPVSLPAGIYVFTASADAGMSVTPTIVSGDCGSDLELGSIIFFTSNGSVQTEQSPVEVEEECDSLLQISNYGSDAWSLSIHKVEAVESIPQTTYTFASSELGLQPVV